MEVSSIMILLNNDDFLKTSNWRGP